MADPLTTGIATAIATGATAALTDGVKVLVTKLAALVRDRFRREPSDQDALAAAIADPSDAAAVRHLAVLLDRCMRDDPAFAQRLRSLWSDIIAASGGDVTNTITGQVHGSVVQARDVQGGVTFNR